MDRELAMRLSRVTLFHLPCVPWERCRRQDEVEGTGEKESKGDIHPPLPPPTFRSQRDTSQTLRINLKDYVTWAAEQSEGFLVYCKWELSGHFMQVFREYFTASDLASSNVDLVDMSQM